MFKFKKLFFGFIIITIVIFTPISTRAQTSPSISVIYPNGGENFKINDKVIVKWSSVGIPETSSVNIFLENKDTGIGYGHSAFIPNNGIREIRIRTDLPSGKYTIRVGSDGLSDDSDSYFDITTQDFNSNVLTNPANSINETSATLNGVYPFLPYDGNHVLFKYADNDQFNNYLISDERVPESSEDITVSTPISSIIKSLTPATRYYFKLCMPNLNAVPTCGETLNFKTLPPSIHILQPNGGSDFTVGDKITVMWESKGIPENDTTIHISIKNVDTNQIINLIESGNTTNNDGIEIVTLPKSLIPGKYKFIISHYMPIIKHESKDESDFLYTIVSKIKPQYEKDVEVKNTTQYNTENPINIPKRTFWGGIIQFFSKLKFW